MKTTGTVRGHGREEQWQNDCYALGERSSAIFDAVHGDPMDQICEPADLAWVRLGALQLPQHFQHQPRFITRLGWAHGTTKPQSVFQAVLCALLAALVMRCWSEEGESQPLDLFVVKRHVHRPQHHIKARHALGDCGEAMNHTWRHKSTHQQICARCGQGAPLRWHALAVSQAGPWFANVQNLGTNAPTPERYAELRALVEAWQQWQRDPNIIR